MGQHLWKQKEGSRVGQKEVLVCDAISVKISASATGSFETGMALYPKLGQKLRPSEPHIALSSDVGYLRQEHVPEKGNCYHNCVLATRELRPSLLKRSIEHIRASNYPPVRGFVCDLKSLTSEGDNQQSGQVATIPAFYL